jgi:CTP synthase (UTP-ammonia lyase)
LLNRQPQLPIQINLLAAHQDAVDEQQYHPSLAHLRLTECDKSYQDHEGQTETRDENSDLGGTMRLGAQKCRIQSDSLVFEMYQKDVITERHRHRYEFNNHYLEPLEKAGLKFSGKSIDGRLVEVVEIAEHPWFLACQFHPEFTSTPRKGPKRIVPPRSEFSSRVSV